MRDDKGILQYNRGCFHGTEEQFIEAVKKKHTGTKFETEYMEAIELIKLKCGAENGND